MLIAVFIGLGASVVGAAESSEQDGFGFGDVVSKARALAEKPYHRPPTRVPEFLLPENEKDTEIYDRYRDIRFRTENSLWRGTGLPFEIQMFHLGLYFEHPVTLQVVDKGVVSAVAYSKDLFDYGKNDFVDQVPADLGFAGFRIHYPLNTPEYYDEIAVFLGASYFRAVGRGHHYGLSARGLALDTALSSGEEFPYFISHWLEKPKPGDTALVFYSLLDSPSISGAYRFVITPGAETVMDIEARLFPRTEISKLGIAPLTSMYFYGENTVHRPVDFRPEVHDSDGLLINAGTGEWIWRPVQNHRGLMFNSFSMSDPRGFGLVQRDRNFDHYQDLEARYDNRPSTWVIPQGAWGEGRVELIQIPTPNEYNDNIVAFWVPKNTPKSGDELSYSYRLRWYLYDPEQAAGGYVRDTKLVPGEDGKEYKVLLNFHGKILEELPPDAKVEAIIDVGQNTELLEHQIHKNEVTDGWRLVFRVRQLDEQPMELRASLKQGEDFLTETWSYSILP